MLRGCWKNRPCHVFTQRRGDVTLGLATYVHGAGAIVESVVMSHAMCAHGAGAIVESIVIKE
jgi:hypothetical protein